MTTTDTTTIRVPVALRDRISSIAKDRGATQVDVVGDAVDLLERDLWWARVRSGLDAWTDEEIAGYQAEALALDEMASDGVE